MSLNILPHFEAKEYPHFQHVNTSHRCSWGNRFDSAIEAAEGYLVLKDIKCVEKVEYVKRKANFLVEEKEVSFIAIEIDESEYVAESLLGKFNLDSFKKTIYKYLDDETSILTEFKNRV